MQHITLSDKQREYIQSKIEHLGTIDKRIDDSSTMVHVDIKHLSIADNDNKIEIDVNMTIPGGNFYVTESGKIPEEAINKAYETLRHQLEKYKSKHKHLHDAAKIPGSKEGEFDNLLEG